VNLFFKNFAITGIWFLRSFWSPYTQFSRSDPRIQFALPKVEPRIHFALVCGARSCPPIKCYSEKEVGQELDLATEAFLEDDSNLAINKTKNKVYISMILKWYSVDFGEDTKEVLIWIYEHMAQVRYLYSFSEFCIFFTF